MLHRISYVLLEIINFLFLFKFQFEMSTKKLLENYKFSQFSFGYEWNEQKKNVFFSLVDGKRG